MSEQIWTRRMTNAEAFRVLAERVAATALNPNYGTPYMCVELDIMVNHGFITEEQSCQMQEHIRKHLIACGSVVVWHLDSEDDPYENDPIGCRVLAALFMALECEDANE